MRAMTSGGTLPRPTPLMVMAALRRIPAGRVIVRPAIDPIATAKVEDLIHALKKDFTIVIVTHNMQQATRCSDKTAFFYLGKLIEFDVTQRIFSNPKEKQTEDYITGRFG